MIYYKKYDLEGNMVMKETKREQIHKAIKKILEDKPEGLRYSEIINTLKEKFPDFPENTLHGSTWDLRQDIIKGEEKDIVCPERGIYILYKYYKELKEEKEPKKQIQEDDFYKKFAEYLKNELEECTRAIPLGGNRFQDKWGTPDVLGVYKFSEADPLRPPLEIISAEIKLDITQLVTAFGQACAYKLFSHKVYLVVPKQANLEISRIESLCMRFGIGLILFNKDNPESPDFEIRTRAAKTEPDYYYSNKYITSLDEKEKKELLG